MVLLAAGLALPADAEQTALDAATAGRLAQLALDCVHREYPNKIAHVMDGDGDARPPRELTPAFYGCYDWHSSVHGHWLLARLAKAQPEAPFAAAAREALARSLTADNLRREENYLEGPGRVSFERPYGLAWLLQLAAELRGWDDEEAQLWAFNLGPLERQAAKRIADWLFVLGVNTLNEHLSYITIRGARKKDHPQSFSYHEPWWDAYHVRAEYTTRLSAALTPIPALLAVVTVKNGSASIKT